MVKLYGNNIVGGIIGSNDSSDASLFQNCYFLNTTAKNVTSYGSTGINCISMKEEEMKSDSFIEQLNKEAGEIMWKKDTENINNGYPIFK